MTFNPNEKHGPSSESAHRPQRLAASAILLDATGARNLRHLEDDVGVQPPDGSSTTPTSLRPVRCTEIKHVPREWYFSEGETAGISTADPQSTVLRDANGRNDVIRNSMQCTYGALYIHPNYGNRQTDDHVTHDERRQLTAGRHSGPRSVALQNASNTSSYFTIYKRASLLQQENKFQDG